MTLEEAKLLKKQQDKPEIVPVPGKELEVILSHIKAALSAGEDYVQLSTSYYLDDQLIECLKGLGYTVVALEIGDNIHPEVTVISGW